MLSWATHMHSEVNWIVQRTLYNGIAIVGCNCPGDSYTGSVYGGNNLYVGNSANGDFYDGTNDNPYNYTNCTDFGNLAYDLFDAPDSLVSNATACCDYCCYINKCINYSCDIWSIC